MRKHEFPLVNDEQAESTGPYTKSTQKQVSTVSFEPTLIKGGCLEEMRQLDSDSIDLILTDPPYNLGLFMKERGAGIMRMRDNYFGSAGWDDLEYDQWVDPMCAMFAESARLLRHGGAMVVFVSVIKVETVVRLAKDNGFYYKTTGTWHKSNPMPRNMNLHFVNSTES